MTDVSPSPEPTAFRLDEGVLELLEREGQRMQAFSLQSLELVQDRAYKLLTLLLAGGGGLGALALANATGSRALVAAMLSGAIWWFMLAAMVAWRALVSRDLPNAAGDPLTWLKHAQSLHTYRLELLSEGAEAPRLEELMRADLLKAVSRRSEVYRTLSVERWQTLDACYRAASLTPAVCALAAVAAWVAS